MIISFILICVIVVALYFAYKAFVFVHNWSDFFLVRWICYGMIILMVVPIVLSLGNLAIAFW